VAVLDLCGYIYHEYSFLLTMCAVPAPQQDCGVSTFESSLHDPRSQRAALVLGARPASDYSANCTVLFQHCVWPTSTTRAASRALEFLQPQTSRLQSVLDAFEYEDSAASHATRETREHDVSMVRTQWMICLTSLSRFVLACYTPARRHPNVTSPFNAPKNSTNPASKYARACRLLFPRASKCGQ
jgi:hypothetical protein